VTPREVTDQLERIASADDFAAESALLTESWSGAGAGLETIEPILRFIEGHPNIDYGAPGALVHFMERFYGTGYEAQLVESVERKPTPPTVWMLNRIINGTKDPDVRQRLTATMERARRNPLGDQVAQNMASRFLERLAR